MPDLALDDRLGVIDVDGVYEAVAKGHCVSHFRQCRIIGGLDVHSGADRGKTLALGSRQSESYLRIYDKAAEQSLYAQSAELDAAVGAGEQAGAARRQSRG